MTERAAELIWLTLGGYAGVGAVVALFLLAGGLRRIDAAAAEASLGVKLVIAPGLIALWPLIVVRLVGVKAREDRL